MIDYDDQADTYIVTVADKKAFVSSHHLAMAKEQQLIRLFVDENMPTKELNKLESWNPQSDTDLMEQDKK